MKIVSSTIRELLIRAEASYGKMDAFRYKAKSNNPDEKKTVVLSKTYTEFKKDSEKFSSALEAIGEKMLTLLFLVQPPTSGLSPIWEP